MKTINNLIDATIVGSLEKINDFIKAGVDIDSVGEYEMTPLHIACDRGYLEVVKYLIENGAKLELQDKFGMTALSCASSNGHIEVVKYLIENGAKLETSDNLGLTPLLRASVFGRLNVVKHLVAKKANIEAKESQGHTALACASALGDTEIVSYLLDRGARIDIIDKKGFTPLTLACSNEHINVIKLLLKKEAKITDEDLEVAKDKPQILEVLTKALKERKAKTKLQNAVEKNNLLALQEAINDGADINYGLQLACQLGNKEIAEELLKQGAEVNSKGFFGVTPLLYAIGNNHFKLAKWLITEKNADVNIANDVDRTALMSACSAHDENVEIQRLLKGQENPLSAEESNQNYELVQLLLDKAVNINAQGKYSFTSTPLISAIKYGHIAIAKLLIAKNANVNLTDRLATALYFASKRGDFELVKLLVEKGAIIESIDFSSSTIGDRDHEEIRTYLKAKYEEQQQQKTMATNSTSGLNSNSSNQYILSDLSPNELQTITARNENELEQIQSEKSTSRFGLKSKLAFGGLGVAMILGGILFLVFPPAGLAFEAIVGIGAALIVLGGVIEVTLVKTAYSGYKQTQAHEKHFIIHHEEEDLDVGIGRDNLTVNHQDRKTDTISQNYPSDQVNKPGNDTSKVASKKEQNQGLERH